MVRHCKDRERPSGFGFLLIHDIPQKQLLQYILDSVSETENNMGSIEQKVVDFYASGMDLATTNPPMLSARKTHYRAYICY